MSNVMERQWRRVVILSPSLCQIRITFRIIVFMVVLFSFESFHSNVCGYIMLPYSIRNTSSHRHLSSNPIFVKKKNNNADDNLVAHRNVVNHIKLNISKNKSDNEKKQRRLNISTTTAKKCIDTLLELEKPITYLAGVGPKTAIGFQRLGITSIRSLLWYFPINFIDRSVMKDINDIHSRIGHVVTVIVTLDTTGNNNNSQEKQEFYNPQSGILKYSCQLVEDLNNDGNQKATSTYVPIKITFFTGKSSKMIVVHRRSMMVNNNYNTKKSGQLRDNPKILVSGKLSCSSYDGTYEIVQPDIVKPYNDNDDGGGGSSTIEPVYRVTKGLTQSRLVKAIDQALDIANDVLQRIPQEILDEETTKRLGWPSTLAEALYLAHRPQSTHDICTIDADMNNTNNNKVNYGTCPPRMRIAFEELCVQQAQLALTRWKYKYPYPTKSNDDSRGQLLSSSSDLFPPPPLSWKDSPLVSLAIESLPFSLTQAQMKCLQEAWTDCISTNGGGNARMARLLQGDVSSGKTVVSYLLGLGCLETATTNHGCFWGSDIAVAILAPTTILANQHERTLTKFVNNLNTKLESLQNSSNNSDKDAHGTNTHHTKPIQKIHVRLLTGSIQGSKRDLILDEIEQCLPGEVYFLVGTHALLSPDVAHRLQNLSRRHDNDDKVESTVKCENNSSTLMKKGLALGIVDEEQRFGVMQRNILSECAAHSLYMTATPIPRSFALAGKLIKSPLDKNNDKNIHQEDNNAANEPMLQVRTGSLDMSILDSKPKGVQTIQTSLVRMNQVDETMKLVIAKIEKNKGSVKVFWVLPRIDHNQSSDDNEDEEELASSEKMGAAVNEEEHDTTTSFSSVVERTQALRRVFGSRDRVGMVHGRMSIAEREDQLKAFANPQSGMDIIVGTTVLEVGVDIPSVTILVVEGAERFGLSQLHQLRGRVGRSTTTDTDETATPKRMDCHCVLLTATTSKDSLQRLDVLRQTNDGSKIALADFELRGPGQVLGLQQSGVKNGFVLDLSCHYDLLDSASILGRAFIERDILMMSSTAMEDNGSKHDTKITSSDTVPNSSNEELSSLNKNENHKLSLVIEEVLQTALQREIQREILSQYTSSSVGGFRLRTLISFFGKWESSLEDNNTNIALYNLQEYASRNKDENNSDDDKKIEHMFISLGKKLSSKNY